VELAIATLLGSIMELETASSQLPLEIPNWVEYWYWPVTSSMIWMPYPLGPLVASRVEAGVQARLPLLAIPSAREGPNLTTLVEGPLRRRTETVLGVVGCQVMVNCSQVGTTWWGALVLRILF
jgi:hypothetical protein